ncbi:MAG: DNA-3-methyladenine glycosylase 2 family protein [Pseudonocardia sp.]|nr:DNA-3-methyladenine glycosylase 2 family protein [Pseudonocardia sp.]
MARHEVDIEVLGPWSLGTSRAFWQGFAPAALPGHEQSQRLRTVFRTEQDWRRVEVVVAQHGGRAHLTVTGAGDLEAAAAQACRLLSLDVDARGWPEVAGRDPVIADAQARLPGLRPCGFHSPYEAAVWAVLSQRIRIPQAARLRDDLLARHGDHGAFPSPGALRGLDLDLPGRKTEYLHAVAEAALEGRLDGASLRAVDPDHAVRTVREIKGLGPFGAELVVIRGANAPDALPQHERRLDAELTERYGPDHRLTDIANAWRPYRTWAALHLRTVREQRTQEISKPRAG